QLRVAVLLDDVDARITADECADLVGERVGAKAQIPGPDSGLARELVAAFVNRVMTRAVADDPDLRVRVVDDRSRHVLFRGLELPREAIDVVLVVVGTLAV